MIINITATTRQKRVNRYLFELIVAGQLSSVNYGIACDIWTKTSPQSSNTFLEVWKI